MNTIIKTTTTYVNGKAFNRFVARGSYQYMLSCTEGVLKFVWSPWGDAVTLTVEDGTEADLLLTLQAGN